MDNHKEKAKEIEGKKQLFKEYLKQNGVLKKIGDVVDSLYETPEKPMNPMDFIKKGMCASDQDMSRAEMKRESDRLRGDNERLRERIKYLEEQIGPMNNDNNEEPQQQQQEGEEENNQQDQEEQQENNENEDNENNQ